MATPPPPSVERIVREISRRAGSHWAVGEIRRGAGVSKTRTWVIIHRLQTLKLIRHESSKRGTRRWLTTRAWHERHLEDIIQDYVWGVRTGMFVAATKSVLASPSKLPNYQFETDHEVQDFISGA